MPGSIPAVDLVHNATLAKPTVPASISPDASAISEAHASTRNNSVRAAIFYGIGTRQIEVVNGTARMADQATPAFLHRLSSALQILDFQKPGFDPLGHDFGKIKVNSSVVAYLNEVRIATKYIGIKYDSLSSLLGAPVSDVKFAGKNYDIPFRQYQYGAIYMMPFGTFAVHGAIYVKYMGLGAERGFLGFPESDEQTTHHANGRFSEFQGGSIYWTAATGAWSVHGAIFAKWRQTDGDRSYLGYPISDEERWSSQDQQRTGRISHFQRGSIVFDYTDGTAYVFPDSVMLVTHPGKSSVGATAELWMNSAGDWSYKGTMHNSGLVGFYVGIVSAPIFQDAQGNVFARSVDRHLDGTSSFGSDRSDSWNDFGSAEPFIRDNWDALKYCGMRSAIEVDFTLGDLLQLIPALFGAAVAAIIVGSVASGGKICPPATTVTRDPSTGQDQPGLAFSVVDQNQPCPR